MRTILAALALFVAGAAHAQSPPTYVVGSTLNLNWGPAVTQWDDLSPIPAGVLVTYTLWVREGTAAARVAGTTTITRTARVLKIPVGLQCYWVTARAADPDSEESLAGNEFCVQVIGRPKRPATPGPMTITTPPP